MGESDFRARLLPGERITWQGQPATGVLFTGRDIFLIPFSLFWCGFVFFWEWGAMQATNAEPANAGPASTIGTVFPLFGIPFILVGLYFVFGRFVVDAWLRARTFYAITNQRVLILRSAPFGKFVSLAIDRLPELSLDERSDGRGTIRFQPRMPMWGSYNGFSAWTPSLDSTQFLMIADARNVFDRIQKLGSKAGN
jgi:hypothetical protein